MSPMPRSTSTSRSSIVTLTVSLIPVPAPAEPAPPLPRRLRRAHGSCEHLERPLDLGRADVCLVDVRRRDDPLERRGALERAAALLDVREELVAELRDVARHGDRVGVAERTQARSVDVLADVEQEVEVCVCPAAGLDLPEDLGDPARPDAAGGALPARLVLVELRDPDPELHHAAAVVDR